MRVRPPATALLAALCLAASGCGDSGPSDEAQIRSALGELQRATAEGDFAALCERILAPDLVETVESIGLSCETAIGRAFGDVEDPRLSIGEVSVDGDRATAQVRTSAQGEEPSEDTVELLRLDGAWRIASLGGSEAPAAPEAP